jgi:type II secretory pathway component GspD/PulD (secretin)
VAEQPAPRTVASTASQPETAKAEAPASPAPAAKTTDPDHLLFNFRGVPLEMVLNYMSEAAGFIINVKPGTSVRGKVELWSSQPLTREEALNALDTVLNQNGLAAIRNGRTLSIVNKDEAKIQDVPVVSESDPNKIPRTDRIVTQIIPVRFVEVAQLVKDLQPLVSLQTTITANDSGNAVVITDTQANIHRIAEIIHDIDMGAEDFTVVKVFHLNNADPTEMADLLTSLFPNNNTSTSQSPMQVGFGGQFGGFRRFFGGGGGQGGAGGGNTSSGTQSQRIKKRTQVTAVADQRTASVVVTATKDLIDQIEAVVTELDANPANIQTVSVINMQNTDPQEALAVLQDIFEKNGTTTSRTANQQSSALTQRSTTQGQQYNSTSRSSMTGGNSRTGIGGSGSIGFGQ